MAKPRLKPPAAALYNDSALTATAHTAASVEDPVLRDWQPWAGSADADLLPDLDLLRPRSRDLARNNGYASAADQTLRDNIVGSQLRLAAQPDARLLGLDRDAARDWATQTESLFATWANDPWEIDAGGSLALLGLTLQALGGWFLNGEAFAIPHWQPRQGTRWNTRLQVIEADRVETPPWLQHRRDLRAGIRIDRYGAPLTYYVRTSHPGDGQYGVADGYPRYRAIPARTAWGRRRVLHLHDKERSGQSRGKPLVTAILREFRLAGQYTSTELQAAVANSLIAAFLKSEMPQDTAASLFATGEQYMDYWRSQTTQHLPRMKGGAIIPLPPTASIEGFQPNRPNSAFEAFMLSVLRHIATGLNLPYELLAKDFSRTNYSSARAALLEAWRYFQGRRRWLQDYWLTPLYELWLEEAVNAGQVAAPAYYANRYAYRRCSWTMSGRGWIDPQKEANAAVTRVQNGLSTLLDECAEQGKDWEDVLHQRAAEQRLSDDLGVNLETVFGPDPVDPAREAV